MRVLRTKKGALLNGCEEQGANKKTPFSLTGKLNDFLSLGYKRKKKIHSTMKAKDLIDGAVILGWLYNDFIWVS